VVVRFVFDGPVGVPVRVDVDGCGGGTFCRVVGR
jgi:hypothetical protein